MRIVALWLAWGCADEADDPVDARVDIPPAPEDGLQIVTGDIEVAAGSEAMFCTFGTYVGDEALAVAASTQWQSPIYGHHSFLFATSADPAEYPDGTTIDCTDASTSLMLEMIPLTMPTAPAVDGVTRMELPDGMAVKLEPGTRYLVQAHYVNASRDAILVRDVVNLDAAATVDTWVATFAHAAMTLSLPPGETTTVQIDCEWQAEAEVLSMFGHMHAHGTSFAVDFAHDDATERIYTIDDWDPSMRDAPPIEFFDAGDLVVAPGDRFVTSCAFDVAADEGELGFPEEMCTFSGLVYPAERPVLCLR